MFTDVLFERDYFELEQFSILNMNDLKFILKGSKLILGIRTIIGKIHV